MQLLGVEHAVDGGNNVVGGDEAACGALAGKY